MHRYGGVSDDAWRTRLAISVSEGKAAPGAEQPDFRPSSAHLKSDPVGSADLVVRNFPAIRCDRERAGYSFQIPFLLIPPRVIGARCQDR